MHTRTEQAEASSETVVSPHVYIVLLNWNGWRDTIECLESVLRLRYPAFTTVVCDNASADDSMAKIKEWTVGRQAAGCGSPALSHLIAPPVPKPLAFLALSREDAEAASADHDAHLVLIQTGANLGFAGGNNVGIRYAFSDSRCEYVWLLNNDTVVDPDALSEMVRMAENTPRLGICGSQLRNYSAPDRVLTMGGRRYSRWSGRTRPLTSPETPRLSTEPGSPDYIEGASMLIRRRCLEEIGLLEESYFLYYEELDYTARALPAYCFGYSDRSLVYHKESASIGSAVQRARRSTVAEYYQARNRILFTWRHHPWQLPSQLAATSISLLQRAAMGRLQNAYAILRGMTAAFRTSKPRVKAPLERSGTA